jgi:glutamine amidotransferase
MSKDSNIVIVDYGVGNIHNAIRAFKKFCPNTRLSGNPKIILQADALVLPGVGSFESGMQGLKKRNLIDPIKEFTASGRPIIGICLGAQLLLSTGYEFGTHSGLGITLGQVEKFPESGNVKIPHIGWGKIYPPKNTEWKDTILENVPKNSSMYFVHSYNLNPDSKDDVLAKAIYGGYEFCAAIKKGNIYGCQFHPERSGEIGLSIIKNFVESI